ncbi:MAG: N-acetylmuramoyl-L-alanine amidase, partial [Cyanobacteriota bacterium]|nr:N-acetylmuramoyl-L-alanine amidase [Cyanobacteriota bacterium]
MWESIALVSSGITLVAFIGAVAAWLYRARIQQSERLIRTAPLQERTRLVEQALESFRIDASGLTKQQQYNLALVQIKEREIRFRTTAIAIVIIAIVFAVVTVLAIQRTPNPLDESDRAYEERLQKLEEAVSKIEENQIPLNDVTNVDSLTVEQDIQEKVNVYENANIPWIDEFAVIIDAGHGGSDPGATVNLMSEKQITLALAREIKNALNKKGMNSRLTRDADTNVSISERVRRGFFYRNSLAVGLHVDAFGN